LALLVLAPTRARADGLFTPWVGVNFANEPAERLTDLRARFDTALS